MNREAACGLVLNPLPLAERDLNHEDAKDTKVHKGLFEPQRLRGTEEHKDGIGVSVLSGLLDLSIIII